MLVACAHRFFSFIGSTFFSCVDLVLKLGGPIDELKTIHAEIEAARKGLIRRKQGGGKGRDQELDMKDIPHEFPRTTRRDKRRSSR